MKRLPLYLGIGIGSFLVFLLLQTPAALLHHWGRAALGPELQVYGISGSLWRGSAGGAYLRGIRLSQIEWQLRPQALLLAGLSHRVTATTDNGTAQAVVGRGFFGTSLRINDLAGDLPLAQLLAAAGLRGLPLVGNVHVQLELLRLRGGRPERVEGAVELGELGWTLASPAVALGGYRAEVATGQQVHAELGDTGGPLELKGQLELTPAGGYSLDLRLRPRASAAAGVVSLLQTLGSADAEGWYRLRREGAL